MPMIHVTPKKGYVILDPWTRRQLPDDGVDMVDDNHWRFLERDGDVTITEAKEQPVAATTPAKTLAEQAAIDIASGKKPNLTVAMPAPPAPAADAPASVEKKV